MKKNIKLRIKEKIKNASEDLLNNRIKSVEENLKIIELSEKLLEKSKNKYKQLISSLVIGTVAIVLVGLSFWIHIPVTTFKLNITVEQVNFSLKEMYKIQPFSNIEGIVINELKEIDAGCLNLEDNSKLPKSLSIRGKGIGIRPFSLNKSADITLSQENHKSSWYVKKDSIHMDIDFPEGEVILKMLDNTKVEISVNVDVNENPPETISLQTKESKGIPINIEIQDTSSWTLTNIPIDTINFLQEIIPNSSEFESAIKSGSIKIFEGKKSYQFEAGDTIAFAELNSKKLKLKITKKNNSLELELVGEAKSIKVGSHTFLTELTPSIFEYLYNEKFVAFFWSAIAFVWSLLWSFKKTILG